MARGHGIIINLSNWLPFIFTYNPESIDSKKVINYAIAPNIGGAYKRRYFSGFESKEINFTLVCVDMESPDGVNQEISYFEQLREPDPGPFGVANSFYGNANFPPPKVLFQYGISYVPLYWDVLSIDINESHFHAGTIRGVLGIPKKCEIDIKLALDESSALNKANQIAKKAEMFAASAKSITRETLHQTRNVRKELPGIFSTQNGKNGILSNKRIDNKY
jgi:hypothetical protein